MQLPAMIIRPDGREIVAFPMDFTTPDGVRHPYTAWEHWTPDDWAQKCPEWAVRTIVDNPPDDEDGAKLCERLPEDAWPVTDEAVTVAYGVTDRSADELIALTEQELIQEKTTAIARVNREAGKARARYITVSVGQEGTYLEKAREARAYLSDTAPDPAHYPYLSAEAECTGQTIGAVALLVATTADAWTPVNARIEGLRQGALTTIRGAKASGEVSVVFPINWPAPA